MVSWNVADQVGMAAQTQGEGLAHTDPVSRLRYDEWVKGGSRHGNAPVALRTQRSIASRPTALVEVAGHEALAEAGHLDHYPAGI